MHRTACVRANALLLESVLKMQSRHAFFGRFERASGGELFAEDETLHGQSFDAKRFTLGYVHDLAVVGPIRFGIGALAGKRFIPSGQDVLAHTEGASYKVFVRLQLQFPRH